MRSPNGPLTRWRGASYAGTAMPRTNHTATRHTLLSADWALPVSNPPLRKGGVVLEGGTIAAVGPVDTLLRNYPHADHRPLLGHILMPGLVNAHTHLELTALKDRVPAGDSFVSWILRLIAERQAMNDAGIAASVQHGLDECLASGTTCLGEIANTPHSLRILRNAGVRGVVFQEILGRPTGDIPARIDALRAHIETLRAAAGERLRVAVAPHSPYTLSSELFARLADYLNTERLPYAIHLAESQDEIDYFLHNRGELKERLFPAVGWNQVHRPPDVGSPLAYLDTFGLLTPRLLAVHGVHLMPQEITRLGQAGASLVICPRSNDILRVGRAPLTTMLKAGIPVGLGTDSLASNPQLSIWQEMKILMEDHPGLDPAAVFRMASRRGAEVLGVAREMGSFEPGRSASFLAVEGTVGTAGEVFEYLTSIGLDAKIEWVE